MERLREEGLGLATISYDSVEILSGFGRANDISFPMLSDVGSATITNFGILNTLVATALASPNMDADLKAQVAQYVTGAEPAERHMGIPFPGTFVVDAQGRVTSRFMEDSYTERTTISNIMVKTGIGEAPVQGTKVSTDHLELTAYSSDAAISRRNHFSLVLEIAPRPGMHVYAPGAEGYRVISLDLDPQSFVTLSPLTFPESEIYYFEPLDERVPVYQEPFKLLQELVLETEPEGADSVTVTGTLEYQACDDKVCYNPTSVPLSWTMSLRPRVGRVAPNPQSRGPGPGGRCTFEGGTPNVPSLEGTSSLRSRPGACRADRLPLAARSIRLETPALEGHDRAASAPPGSLPPC